MNSACFIFEAGAAIGIGHAMRCLTLADRLSQFGWRCTLAGFGATAEVVRRHAGERYEYLEAAIPLGRRDRHWDLIVIDHYGRDADFEALLRPQAGRMMAIDDLADRRHDVDILLDQGGLRRAGDYDGLVPKDCQLLLGTDYALLKPEFAEQPAQRGATLRRILVSLGGADPQNVTGRILTVIAGVMPHAGIDLVATAVMPHLDALREQAAQMPQVTLHVDTQGLIDLMRKADLGIGAGGMTSWERCATGLPSLVVQIADNQKDVLSALCRANAAISLGLPDDGLEQRVERALTDLRAVPSRLSDMAAAGRALCDGRGTMRVLCALIGQRASKSGHPVTLRAVSEKDCEQLFQWQSIPEVRRFARNPQAPAWSEHTAWFSERYWQPDRFWAIIQCGAMPAGLLRLDPSSDMKSGLEVSILLDPRFHGDGIGRAALALARRAVPGRDLWAFVMNENRSSQAMFASAGYEPQADGWSISRMQSAKVH